ncbi:MAG: hydrolase [Chloroflexota bacterium]|nr:MAG: hydrolase [Chloroflexota bacterium]
MKAEFQDKFVTVNGLKLHYVEWNAGKNGISQKPVMLLLHGVTGNARLWDHIAHAFQHEYRVLALDMRGHGDSGWSSKEAYESTDLASDLAAFFIGLGLRKAIIIGLSWGGLVGLIHTAEYPDTVHKLVLVDIGCEFDEPETAVPNRPQAFEDEQSLETYERSANPFPAMWTMRPGIRASVREENGKLVRKHDPVFAKRWPFRNMSYWEYAKRVACPTLLLRGAHSFVLSAEIAARTAESIPGCHFEEIPNSAHLIPLDNPPAFEAAVRKFLAQ